MADTISEWKNAACKLELENRRLRHAISMLVTADISPKQRRRIAEESLRYEVSVCDS